MDPKRTVIIGAAGMDYHVYLTNYKNDIAHQVLAFAMAGKQNLETTDTELRHFPYSLAGDLYPDGIPTIPRAELTKFIKENDIDEAVLAYSDASHERVMHTASEVLAAGASFKLISPKHTQLTSRKPVISICAVRTGCGKSQASRKIVHILKDKGYRVAAIREPMPYGDLEKQACMRFSTLDDLEKFDCTFEEMEEYEPYIEQGLVIYSGVDYAKILAAAEKEADIIVFDGGNNEISFYKPDLLFVLTDPIRPGHELAYHPGEVNARMADYFIINKENTAAATDIDLVASNLRELNKLAPIIHADSPITVDHPELARGKLAIVIEDGPTVTHGGAEYGAGYHAACELECKLVIPKRYCTGSLLQAYTDFPHMNEIIPSMGYSRQQIKELEHAINSSPAEVVINGTPMDLSRVLEINKPMVRVTYDIQEKGEPNLETVLTEFINR